MAEKKTKIDNSLLRVPQPKKKLGLKVPTIRMPHEDLIKPEFPKAVENIAEQPGIENTLQSENSMTSQSSHTSISSPTTHTRQTSHTRDETPDAKRNFQKIANSVTDVAIPNGYFKPGKSKHLYDILLGITRGDFPAKFSVRLPKGKLMKLAQIGSKVTFDECIAHLESVGLVKVDVRIGEHEGNIYEVFFPHEISAESMTSMTSHTSHTSSTQKLDGLVTLESSQTSQSLNPTNTGLSDNLKTLYKTNTIDDEAFSDFIESLQSFALRIHGRKIKDLTETAKVLVAELEKRNAISRISDIDKFLAEHLRRVFVQGGDKKKTETKKDTVGKDSGEIDIGKEYQALVDLLEFDTLETVLEKLDTYDYPDDVKRELSEMLKRENPPT